MKSVTALPFCLIIALGIVGCCTGKSNVGVFQTEDQMRNRILSHTPIGMNVTEVLAFIVDDMCPKKKLYAPQNYINKIHPGGSSKIRVLPDDESHRKIRVVLSSYPVGVFTDNITEVTWSFDSHDRLTDIHANRQDVFSM